MLPLLPTLAAVLLLQPAPLVPRTVPADTAESVRRWNALIEGAQTPAGRVSGAANAWSKAIDSLAIVVRATAAPDHSPFEKSSIDFANIAPLPPPGAPGTPLDDILGLSLLDELEKANAFAPFTPAAPRAARPSPNSPEFARMFTDQNLNVEPWDGRFSAILLPDLGAFRRLGTILAARFRVALTAPAPDGPRAAHSFEAILTLARISAFQPTSIDRRVAVALFTLAATNAENAALAGKLNAPTARAMAAALDRQPAWPPLAYVLEGERLITLDDLRAIFSGENGAVDPQQLTEIQSLRSASPRPFDHTRLTATPPRREASAATANDYYDKIITDAGSTPRERAQVPLYPSGLAKQLPPSEFVVAAILPDLDALFRDSDARIAGLVRLRVVLALEVFRAENGKYPKTLGELQGIETTDPWTGAPMIYTRLDEPSGYSLHLTRDPRP